MTVNDILMFIVFGTYAGQRWENSYFYRVQQASGVFVEGDFPSLVESWLNEFLTTIFNPHASLFSTGLSVDGARGENLFNVGGIGAFTLISPILGTNGQEAAPPQQAYGWSTPSLKRGMNAGQRRMAGCTTEHVLGYGMLTPQATTELNNMGADMGLDMNLSYGDNEAEVVIRPVIVKRVRSGAGTDEDPYEYRLPRQASEGVTYRANNWTTKPYVTTQNSRKYGRGQ